MGALGDMTGALRANLRVGVLAAGVPALAAIGLWVAFAPASNWSDPVLLFALAAIAALTLASQVHQDSRPHGGVRIDASYAVVLLTLAISGPLPAFLVWAVPELIGRFFLRGVPVLSIGAVATISSFALAVLAASHLLAGVAEGGAIAQLALAGLVLAAVNYLVAAPYFSLVQWGPRRAVADGRQILRVTGPAAIGAILVGVLAWVALPALGVGALMLMAVSVLLPEWALARISVSTPVRELGEEGAASLYAEAIADVVGMGRRDRQIVALAATNPRRARKGAYRDLGDELARWLTCLAPLPADTDAMSLEAGLVAIRTGERFDGGDWPYGLASLSEAPVQSRIIDVARAWASLTAGETKSLSHREAMLELRDRAGTELDPAMVAAASRVVERETLLLGTQDFQPKSHRLPLPRPVRHRGLVALGRAA